MSALGTPRGSRGCSAARRRWAVAMAVETAVDTAATATVEWQRLWLRRRKRCGRRRRNRRRTSPAHSEHKHTSAKLASRRSGR